MTDPSFRAELRKAYINQPDRVSENGMGLRERYICFYWRLGVKTKVKTKSRSQLQSTTTQPSDATVSMSRDSTEGVCSRSVSIFVIQFFFCSCVLSPEKLWKAEGRTLSGKWIKTPGDGQRGRRYRYHSVRSFFALRELLPGPLSASFFPPCPISKLRNPTSSGTTFEVNFGFAQRIPAALLSRLPCPEYWYFISGFGFFLLVLPLAQKCIFLLLSMSGLRPVTVRARTAISEWPETRPIFLYFPYSGYKK